MAQGALHEELRRDEAPKGSSDRGFGLVFAVVFAIVAAWPLMGGGGPRLWALAVAAGFAALAFAAPRALAPLNRLWTRFGLLLARITNPLVMGLMFFAVVTPMGLAMRALGKDPLRRRFEPGAASYWMERRPPGPAPMSRQF
jgi:predicted membrane metal-binding protein